MSYHKLLERQIRRHLADGVRPDDLASLLAAISEAYGDADVDRSAIELSLELMSTELTERNAQLQFELQERHVVEQALLQEHSEQQALIKKLEEAHHQLLQAEKMASIGQLAAGVAHEINNPIGFVGSNMGTLRKYVQSLLDLIAAYESHEADMAESIRERMSSLRMQIDLAYLRQDIPNLVSESIDGIDRVRKIVQDLKDFSHVDEAQWQWADLRSGLDSTLNIVQNEIKYVAEVVKNYGDIPDVECMPSQLNQVFMNLLVNAAHAMHERHGKITVTVGMSLPTAVFVEIADEGHGIAPENLKRIFDPFFTTKPVGKGTGLGLSLSYGIVKKHHGQITVGSQSGGGTVFRMVLPIRQPINSPE
ncbi:ATP-binding protein [Aquabacterium sp.]|uniref:ATP-binding protein n=1 Tax=Aquabacterium sp. TaxID=1872578 RepID=UPI00248790C2|nr:ATP-binding protein [Aquabacterium sp.]MDI1260009.1 ATP-binding protein [Aquabacterium sp.]